MFINIADTFFLIRNNILTNTSGSNYFLKMFFFQNG